MPKLSPQGEHTVDHRGVPYLAHRPAPEIVSDEMLVAVVKGVTQAFTEIATAKKKTETTATDGQTLRAQ